LITRRLSAGKSVDEVAPRWRLQWGVSCPHDRKLPTTWIWPVVDDRPRAVGRVQPLPIILAARAIDGTKTAAAKNALWIMAFMAGSFQ
jgi:hypothetical protein